VDIGGGDFPASNYQLMSGKKRAPLKKNPTTKIAEHNVMSALKAQNADVKKSKIERNYGKWSGRARFIVAGVFQRRNGHPVSYYASWIQGEMVVTSSGVVDWTQQGETGYVTNYPSPEAAIQGVVDTGGGDFGGGKVVMSRAR
jgi:hypothetical protein